MIYEEAANFMNPNDSFLPSAFTHTSSPPALPSSSFYNITLSSHHSFITPPSSHSHQQCPRCESLELRIQSLEKRLQLLEKYLS
jgi:hypothetical protein